MKEFFCILTALCLAVTFVAAGLAACLAPPVTHALSGAFARDDISPFTREQLVAVADATREFSFGNHDEKALYQTIFEVDCQYADAQKAANKMLPQDFPKIASVIDAKSTNQIAVAFEGASVMYCYDEQTVSHLDDCYLLFIGALPGLVIAAVLAVIGCFYLGIRARSKTLGRVILASGVIVVVAFVALGVWAIVDFDGFFTAFHQTFFAQQGNWTFPYDSLLICALPEAFWMGMGAVWLVVVLALSALAIVVGRKLARRAKR